MSRLLSSQRHGRLSRYIAGALVLCAGGLAAAWWWPSRGVVRRAPGLNVLLITVDTLRADAVGAYGDARGTTPWIDRLAAAGVRFADARAHNVVTLPSHANILSGRGPSSHGVRDNAGFRFPADVETLATVLKARGYRTAAFVSAFPLDSRFGLDRGFDVYDDRLSESGRPPAFLIQERRGDRTVALARQWIDASAATPWFCWVHLYEPHYPYDPPPAIAARWRGDPYAGEVAAADAALAPLLEPILAAGDANPTLVVLTSDHGESLNEHGEATHGIFAYEAVLRVPLVLHQPRLFSPTVSSAPAAHVDVLPTVLDVLDIPPPPGLAGRSLAPLIVGAGDADTRVLYFEALSGTLNRGWAPLVGVVLDGFKYIDLPIPELYDLRADPREERNLAEGEPAKVASLRTLLEPFRSSAPVRATHRESAEARERLRSLGYASGAGEPRERHSEADDPKRLMALDALLQDILDRYLSGDVSGALLKCRDLVQRRPDMALGWMYLAQLEREARNPGAALEALRRVRALMPGNPEPVALSGAYLTEAGRADEAAELLAPYADAPDADADIVTARAVALGRIGRTGDALHALERLRHRDPRNAMVLVHIGTIQLGANNRAAARAVFEEAIRLDADLARAHSSLGAMAAEDGDAGRAREHWRAATATDPREHGTILTLGIAFSRSGRIAAARTALDFFAAHAPEQQYAGELAQARAWLTAHR